MPLDSLTNKLKDWVDDFVHYEWLSTFIVVLVILAITAIVAHVATTFLRRILKSNKGPLPAVSLFVNIGRITVWTIGISIMLSSCFNVNVGAAVTALGIGGIAISLGFQDTLSNLIGGLQIIMSGLIEPGDRIKVDNFEGVVHDVTWRHTTITNVRGERVVVPNSVINTQALIKLPPENDVRVEIAITDRGEPLDKLIEHMQKEIDKAASKVAVLEGKSHISVMSKTEFGYKALVTLTTGSGVDKSVVVDAMMKAISKCAVKAHPAKKHKKSLAKELLSIEGGGVSNGK